MIEKIISSGEDGILTLEETGSTNTYLLEHADLWEKNFFTVRAVNQTAGRGRHGRSWHSGPGLDLAFSTVFHLPEGIGTPAAVTLCAGLAAYRSLAPIIGGNLRIKWPNDLCWGDKKIGGILCELARSGEGRVVIIGIGVNVNSGGFPPEIESSAASLRTITGEKHSVEELMRAILDELKALLADFNGTLDIETHRELLSSVKAAGTRVAFERDSAKMSGTVTGINRDGSLAIELDGGGEYSCYGEIFFI